MNDVATISELELIVFGADDLKCESSHTDAITEPCSHTVVARARKRCDGSTTLWCTGAHASGTRAMALGTHICANCRANVNACWSVISI